MDGANNKAKTLQMGNVNGRKFTEKKKKENKVEEFHLANLVSLGSLASNDSVIRHKF